MSHPAPLVPARPAEADELPRTARTLITKATAAGWASSASYAKGTALPSRGQELGNITESLVVRLELPAGGARAVAVWLDGKFEVAFRWASWLELETVGARALSTWITTMAQLVEDGLEVPA